MSASTGATHHHGRAGDDLATKGVSSMPDYAIFVGIDLGATAHRVQVLAPGGERLAERTVEHSGPGLAAVADYLVGLAAEPGQVAVGLEVPRGAVVDTLLERGCHVYGLNPKQLDRFRDRHSVAGAKDDRRDAFVLADALRTDRPAFRRLAQDDPLVVQLRELSRLHEELGQEHTRLANRLRDQLLRYFPQVLPLCPAADEPWLWTLLTEAATPAAAQALTVSALRRVLSAHRIRRVSVEALHTAVQVPALRVAPGTVEAASDHVTLLLPRLRVVHEQRTRCAHRLDALLDTLAAAGDQPEHRDVKILRSLPGLGSIIAATMLAEGARPLAARDYQSLRAHTGVAPVTRQSGKQRLVLMRRACNPRLRNALYHWAFASLRLDAHCRAHYDRLRQHHGHARALRGVADRLLRLLITLLTTGTLYDATRCRVAEESA
jgi:transposase